MLLAGGAGVSAGTALSYAHNPSIGWLGASLLIGLGLAYEAYQIYDWE